jgi:hypothetical protein
MNALKKRLTCVEAQWKWELCAEAGRLYGLTAKEVLDEARRFLPLTPEEQRQRFAELAHSPHLTEEERSTVEAGERDFFRCKGGRGGSACCSCRQGTV